jgi:phage I-like protein
MPTIQEQKPKLEALKAKLEQEESMETMRGAVALTAQSVDEQGLSWIEVMPLAENAKNGKWLFTITAEDLQAAADFIQASPDRIPIDYDHAGAEGGSTKAAGWFTGNAEVRGESLWAEVKWTPAAVQEIRDGSFRFVSPEWEMQNRDKKTGLLTKFKELAAATLTNRPFFSEMAPVTAKLEPEQVDALTESYSADVADLVLAGLEAETDHATKAAEAVLAAIGKPEEGGNPSAADQGNPEAGPIKAELNDPKEIIVADEQPVTDYMKMLGLDETVDPKHRLAAAFREKDEKILALEQERTELTAKLAEADKLNDRVAELETRDRERDIEVILAKAVDKGRVFPAEKEKLAEIFAKDVNGLRQLIATRPTEMFAQLEPRGVSGDADRFIDDPDVSRYAKSLGAQDPVDTEQAKQHLMAMDILKEQGKADKYTNDEYIEAYTRAEQLVY